MTEPLERKLVERVKFLLRQWSGRRVLYNDSAVACLDEALFSERILVHHLQVECLGISLLPCGIRPVGDLVPEGDLFEGGKLDIFKRTD